jgi:hypothetical protein
MIKMKIDFFLMTLNMHVYAKHIDGWGMETNIYFLQD